ncbi:MAG: protein-L-isoaspartate(D-aspartate) O-methyltransferase [Chloroflexi bacterium]|nr:protein-L-isoaspartate(D-aspartate) O-methyltransferase [Chloroflexota bacterium]
MDEDFARQRAQMVDEQLIARGIDDTAVIAAMGEIPREHFVLAPYQHYAYRDGPIPIPARQTVSQPYVVAHMLSELQLQPTGRVLEIGTGSGYAAAVLSRIVQTVYTVERHKNLVNYARSRLANLNCDNVLVHHGDGSLGWAEHAPYDAIIVAAGGPKLPKSLQAQLVINGRLIMPVGKHNGQVLMLVRRASERKFVRKRLSAVRFVPLIGYEGWRKKDD